MFLQQLRHTHLKMLTADAINPTHVQLFPAVSLWTKKTPPRRYQHVRNGPPHGIVKPRTLRWKLHSTSLQPETVHLLQQQGTANFSQGSFISTPGTFEACRRKHPRGSLAPSVVSSTTNTKKREVSSGSMKYDVRAGSVQGGEGEKAHPVKGKKVGATRM